MTRGQTLLHFNFVNHLGNKPNMVRTGDFGHGDGTDVLANRGFQIPHRQPPGSVYAHQHVETVGRHRGRSLRHHGPCAGFLSENHTVFEVKNNGIGTTGVGLGDKLFDIGGHKQ